MDYRYIEDYIGATYGCKARIQYVPQTPHHAKSPLTFTCIHFEDQLLSVHFLKQLFKM